MLEQKNLHPETLALHTSIPASQYGENSEALYLTSCFVQPSAEESAQRFAGQIEGYTYSRTSNPSVSAFEARLAALEQTESAIGTSSGMSAILLLALSLLKSGDHVICSRSVFGSTLGLLGKEFARFGVETSFVSQTDINEWKAAIKSGRTKLLFAETPTNPLTEICDIKALAELAHNAGAELAVDNCFATPILQRPATLGADYIIHSGTKYLDGQGRVMAGAICANKKTVDEKFMPMVRTAGMVLAPFNAWVVHKGLETLAIRVEKQSQNALEIAKWLEKHPQIERVYYPALESHPQHDLAKEQMSAGGGVISFRIKAGADIEKQRSAAFKLLDSTKICRLATNLGDTKTLICHPASTSHGRLSEELRQTAGITQNLVRLAVGLEHPEDIQNDLAQGLL